MKFFGIVANTVSILLCVFIIYSCQQHKNQVSEIPVIRYENFRDSVLRTDSVASSEPVNVFDARIFIPGKDSLDTLLVKIDTVLRREIRLLSQYDTLKKGLGKNPGFSAQDSVYLLENIKAVEDYLAHRDSSDSDTCRGITCMVYALVDKKNQRMYLYILGELKDTFKVSTGKGKKYETPEMSLHPRGPILTRYSSRKYPGGSYKGLGNMPYAVFLKDGYAIHGTTAGNISQLGTPASHGCVRLHPDDAKVFNALVKTVGLGKTWVEIKDSLTNSTHF
ncbi:MAG: L,D-transpeptidase [Chitinophagaceae bacterium]|nr:L,D-transpeptidase [Chitinophagaceae bacterium]